MQAEDAPTPFPVPLACLDLLDRPPPYSSADRSKTTEPSRSRSAPPLPSSARRATTSRAPTSSLGSRTPPRQQRRSPRRTRSPTTRPATRPRNPSRLHPARLRPCRPRTTRRSTARAEEPMRRRRPSSRATSPSSSRARWLGRLRWSGVSPWARSRVLDPRDESPRWVNGSRSWQREGFSSLPRSRGK